MSGKVVSRRSCRSSESLADDLSEGRPAVERDREIDQIGARVRYGQCHEDGVGVRRQVRQVNWFEMHGPPAIAGGLFYRLGLQVLNRILHFP